MAKASVTSFSTTPLTMAPLSGPPWPGSMTIVGLPGAAAGKATASTASAGTVPCAAARKALRSVLASDTTSCVRPPLSLTAAPTTRAGVARSITTRERPGASRPKRKEATRVLVTRRPLAGRPTLASSANSTCGRSSTTRSGIGHDEGFGLDRTRNIENKPGGIETALDTGGGDHDPCRTVRLGGSADAHHASGTDGPNQPAKDQGDGRDRQPRPHADASMLAHATPVALWKTRTLRRRR